VQHIECGIPVL